MSNKIGCLPLSTKYTVEQALQAALQEPLSDVVIIGNYNDCELFAVSSRMNHASALWLIEQAKHHCLFGDQPDDR